MTFNKLYKFEKPNNISINIYSLELIDNNGRSYFSTSPARVTQNKLEKHINLVIVIDKYFLKLSYYDDEIPPQSSSSLLSPVKSTNGSNNNAMTRIRYYYCWKKIYLD